MGTGVPKRLIVMFSPNGTLREEWVKDVEGNSFKLGPILEPLADVRERLLILRGLDSDVAHSGGPGDGHQTGMGCMLTGRQLLSGTSKGGCGSCPPAGLASGISFDQHLANAIGESSAFKYLALGVKTSTRVDAWTRMSYSGRDQAISPENDPRRVYDRIFSRAEELNMDGAAARRLLAKRGSAYGAVKEELTAFRDYVPSDDQRKLDQHLSFVEELESRVDNVAPSCDIPSAVGDKAEAADDSFRDIGSAHMDLAVHALACDLTRVVTLQWSQSVGGQVHSWLGVNRGHHGLSHEVDSNQDSYRDIRKIDTWYAEQFGYLVRKLESQTAEDGKPLIDHTVVLWVNELARGSSHSRRNQSWLMAGNLDGYLRTGRHVDLGGRSNNDLFVTLLQGFGLSDTTFGASAFNEGPLGMLTA